MGWHFYDGSSIVIYVIGEGGNLNKILLGRNIEKGESLQTVIKHNSWFAAELSDKTSFALIGCTVVPNRNCIAFYVETREGVDEVGEIVKAAGGRSIEGPEFCPDTGEGNGDSVK